MVFDLIEKERQAIIEHGEIRCPVCGRKCGEITGNEEVKNFRILCKGTRTNGNQKHYFILNVERGKKYD